MNQNKEISQKEHIELLQQHRKKDLLSVSGQIDKNYEKYVQGEDEVLEDIIEALDKRYRRIVIHQLYIAGCHDDENVHTAMQEARIAVWSSLQKARTEKLEEACFSQKCKGIYYHKVMDVVRNVSRKKKHFEGGIASIDIELENGNGTIADLIEHQQHKGNRPECVIRDDEKRNFFEVAFEMYCKALTESAAEPPRCLSLYYSRILPHMLQIGFDVKTIPGSKAASPKWAIEKMGKRDIGTLSTESEMQMKKYVSAQLIWCEDYKNRLKENVSLPEGVQRMEELILTKHYDEKQIGHMADYMHITVAKDWVRLMKKDSEMLENAIEYTKGLDKITKVLRGGAGR